MSGGDFAGKPAHSRLIRALVDLPAVLLELKDQKYNSPNRFTVLTMKGLTPEQAKELIDLDAIAVPKPGTLDESQEARREILTKMAEGLSEGDATRIVELLKREYSNSIEYSRRPMDPDNTKHNLKNKNDDNGELEKALFKGFTAEEIAFFKKYEEMRWMNFDRFL